MNSGSEFVEVALSALSTVFVLNKMFEKATVVKTSSIASSSVLESSIIISSLVWSSCAIHLLL